MKASTPWCPSAGAVPDDGDELSRELQHARANAVAKAQRLRQTEVHVAGGHIELLEATEDERRLSDRFTTREPDPSLRILVALDDGEAACLAIAVERGRTLGTDDGDALRVLDRFAHGLPYERMRRLRIRAATDGLMTEAEANGFHDEMTRAGFWDRCDPSPRREEPSRMCADVGGEIPEIHRFGVRAVNPWVYWTALSIMAMFAGLLVWAG